MTELERIAREFVRLSKARYGAGGPRSERWEDLEEDEQAMCLDVLRLALTAARDPTHEMTEHVVPVTHDRTEACRIWTGIVDGILEEHP